MTSIGLIWKELWQRPSAMTTCLLVIALGIASLVAIRSITVHSEQAVSEQLESLGANVLLLPNSVSLQDYYAADSHSKTLPEEHATRLVLASLEGVENVSPKLCVPADLAGRKITLTGILPQSEFEAKAAWQTAQVFSRKHAGCKKPAAVAHDDLSAAESLATRRFVRDLGENELLLGADVAEFSKLKIGDRVTLLGYSFRVSSVLPSTGTVDDGRVFAHLHRVQELAKAGEVVNVIEIMACCDDAAGALQGNLAEMFPDAKVVTISQVVDTQISVNRLMSRISYLFLGILIVVGMATTAGTMFANVRDRRREIGTLMAMGATPGFVSRLILGKALIVGIVGGVIGYAIGTVFAIVAGPHWAGVYVQPLPSLAAVSAATALGVALLASYLPARRAALLDPCLCFREV